MEGGSERAQRSALQRIAAQRSAAQQPHVVFYFFVLSSFYLPVYSPRLLLRAWAHNPERRCRLSVPAHHLTRCGTKERQLCFLFFQVA